MKKIVQLLVLLLITSNFSLRAYDFKVGSICYNIISLDNYEVEVTADDTKYTGSIIIPPKVQYANKEFTVTKIANRAFYQCSDLKRVEIPNTIKSIGTYVYDNGYGGCESEVFAYSGITEITIPNSVIEIGSASFNRCYSLKKLIIEDGSSTLILGFGRITTWENEIYGLFADAKLDEVYIGRDLFYKFKYYWWSTPYTIAPFKPSSRTDVSSRPTIQTATFGNNVTTVSEQLFWGCNTLKTVTLGERISKIDDSAFYNTAIESVVFPNTLDSIGKNAFYGCALKNINLIDNIKYVGEAAFSYCSALNSITFGNGCTVINPKCFQACSSLTSVSIPDNITAIGSSAFEDCSNLASIVLSSSIDSLGFDCFKGTGFKRIVLPNSIKTIPFECFSGCKSLENISLPNELSSIGISAFSGCTSLKSITLPESVVEMGSKAFYEDNNLTSITVKNSNPITITEDVFANMSYILGTLYVPVGHYNDYKNADTWSKFNTIVEGEGSGDQPSSSDISLTITCSEGGTVIFNQLEISNETITTNVEENSTLVFVIEALPGYKLSKVIFNDIDVTSFIDNDILTVNGISNNSSINVVFEELPKYLTIKQSNQCDLILFVKKGESYKIRIPLQDASLLQSITFNNIDVTSQLSEDLTYETPKIYDNAVLIIKLYDNPKTNADVNKDGEVNIADVNSVINVILSN